MESWCVVLASLRIQSLKRNDSSKRMKDILRRSLMNFKVVSYVDAHDETVYQVVVNENIVCETHFLYYLKLFINAILEEE